MHSHDHHGNSDIVGVKLLFSVFFNLAITLSEIIGGIISGSLALVSDALHNLSDTGALLTSYFARKISKKPRDLKFTYGYKRAETIAAIINTTILLAISFSLIVEGIRKIIQPTEINTDIMLIIAYIGLAGNLLTAILLFSHSKENLNLKSSFLHILSDLLSSIAIIITGHIMQFYNLYILDPIITFLISAYIIIESIHILKDAITITMQAVPDGVNFEVIKDKIESLPFVKDMHHTHIWSLDGNNLFIESHIKVIGKDYDNYLKEIKAILNKNGISHSTIQIESEYCDDFCIEEKD